MHDAHPAVRAAAPPPPAAPCSRGSTSRSVRPHRRQVVHLAVPAAPGTSPAASASRRPRCRNSGPACAISTSAQAGDRLADISRGGGCDPLGVRQVAGVLLGHGRRPAAPSAASNGIAASNSLMSRHAGGELTRPVARTRRRRRAARPYSFIAAPHPAELTITASDSRRRKASMLARASRRAVRSVPVVAVQRPAAGLRRRRDHLAAVASEDADRRAVHAAVGVRHDAAGQQRDPPRRLRRPRQHPAAR